jgi:hypothetical protein
MNFLSFFCDFAVGVDSYRQGCVRDTKFRRQRRAVLSLSSAATGVNFVFLLPDQQMLNPRS